MLAFAIRRLLEALVVMLSVALIAFMLFRYVGDPVHQMVGQDATLEDRDAIRRELGLDDPHVMGGLVVGQLDRDAGAFLGLDPLIRVGE